MGVVCRLTGTRACDSKRSPCWCVSAFVSVDSRSGSAHARTLQGVEDQDAFFEFINFNLIPGDYGEKLEQAVAQVSQR